MIVNVLGLACPKVKKICKSAAIIALREMQTPCVELTIKFVSDTEIKRLNSAHRGIDKVTDVLSFPATDIRAGEEVVGGDGTYLGDMAICLKRAKSQAKEYGNTYFAEIQKLVLHSVLHLLGYDHIKDEDYAIMNKKEEQIARALHIGG